MFRARQTAQGAGQRAAALRQQQASCQKQRHDKRQLIARFIAHNRSVPGSGYAARKGLGFFRNLQNRRGPETKINGRRPQFQQIFSLFRR